MAPFTARCQVTTPPVSGTLEDAVVNTFYFTMESADRSTQAPVIAEEIEDLYEACISYLSDEYKWDTQTYKFYDMEDSLPRTPFYEAVHGTGVAPTTQAAMPRECALVISFQGFKASGVPQARRRGRIFLGPFGISANTDGRPTGALVTAAVAGAQQLLDISQSTSGWEWVVRSGGRYHEDGELVITSPSTIPVDNGWVDNEWDTQRSRGRDATSRTIFN